MVSSQTMRNWTKSSFCRREGGCPEVKQEGDVILMRESESPDEVRVLKKAEWIGFIRGVKVGEFDPA
jgi:hypothetical protein